MESAPDKIVVIIGPTASGKSALAMRVAQKYGGEIICADSRTVYKGMDIGTAKPGAEDRDLIRHHCLDLVEPDQTFSAAEFKKLAQAAVNEIRGRGRLPIIAGGTGLYVDGFVYDFDFAAKPDPALRQELESMNLLQLQQRALLVGIAADHPSFNNPRHLQREIERGGATQTRKHLPQNTILIGLRVPNETLRIRITDRVGTMFNNGFIEEAERLYKNYGPDAPGLLAPGYKAVREYLDGTISLEEAKEAFIRNDYQLARRQMTWFKRNPDIKWVETGDEAMDLIGGLLQ